MSTLNIISFVESANIKESHWLKNIKKYAQVKLNCQKSEIVKLVCYPLKDYIFTNSDYNNLLKIISQTTLEDGNFLTSYFFRANKQEIVFLAPKEILIDVVDQP